MTDLPGGFRIRAATAADHAALKEICLRTGDSGGDGTHLHDDPDLLGMVYAVPYQVFAPQFALVAEDAGGVCGSCLGVADSAAFDDWMDRVWYPPLRARLRDPGPDPAQWRHSDWVRARILGPRRAPAADPRLFPAHGHIDLLPRARGRGVGRAMMERLAHALHAAGAPGLFLEVAPRNSRAQGFYRHLGYRTLATLPDAVIMGLELVCTPQN